MYPFKALSFLHQPKDNPGQVQKNELNTIVSTGQTANQDVTISLIYLLLIPRVSLGHYFQPIQHMPIVPRHWMVKADMHLICADR